MKQTPFQRDIKQTVKRSVDESIRQAGFLHEADPYLPPPADVDAEAEIASALLAGYVRPHELAPLERHHFYSHVIGAIFEATKDVVEPGDLEAVRRNLANLGWRGALDDELRVTAFMQPWASIARVRQLAALVVELHAQRELIAQIKRIDRGLRIGEFDRTHARRLLAEAAA